jgi:hypothetical protein
MGRWAPAALLLLGSCGESSAAALRAGAVLAALGGAAVLLRRRAGGARDGRPVRVEALQPLARDAGVAVVRSGDLRLLVGYGRCGVRLLSRLDGREEAG